MIYAITLPLMLLADAIAACYYAMICHITLYRCLFLRHASATPPRLRAFDTLFSTRLFFLRFSHFRFAEFRFFIPCRHFRHFSLLPFRRCFRIIIDADDALCRRFLSPAGCQRRILIAFMPPRRRCHRPLRHYVFFFDFTIIFAFTIIFRHFRFDTPFRHFAYCRRLLLPLSCRFHFLRYAAIDTMPLIPPPTAISPPCHYADAALFPTPC
jgi:hypothetical protein